MSGASGATDEGGRRNERNEPAAPEWCEEGGETEPTTYAVASFSPTVGACLGVGGRAVSEEREGIGSSSIRSCR